YVVPTSRVVVPTGRAVPAGRAVPVGRDVPTSRVVPAGRSCWSFLLVLIWSFLLVGSMCAGTL
nr:hypothetical protein [Tanacetum cinerariifolium]